MTGFDIPGALRGDDLAVALEVRAVQAAGTAEISDGCARAIASWWFRHRDPAGSLFAWTGEVTADADGDTSELWRQLGGREYATPDLPPWERAALDCLGTYLANRDNRDAVSGWMDLHVT